MSTREKPESPAILGKLYGRGRSVLARVILEPTLSSDTFVVAEGFVDELVRYVAAQPEISIDWATNVPADSGEYLIEHSLNMAMMATVYGIEAEYPDDALIAFALAGYLHDLGMFDLPYRLVYETEKLSPEQRTEMRQHPYLSRRRLQHLGEISEDIVFGIQDEHECEDGTGYPEQKSSDTIHRFGKALHVIDVYEALTHARPYRPQPLMPQQTMLQLLSMAKQGKIDPKAVHLWLNRMSYYPIGSYVRLNNGFRAKVASVHHGNPLQPIVVVFQEPGGDDLEHPWVLDLVEAPHLHIVEAIPRDGTCSNIDSLVTSVDDGSVGEGSAESNDGYGESESGEEAEESEGFQ